MINKDFDEVAWEAFQEAAAEKYDFRQCSRGDGDTYGIADNKKCRQGADMGTGKKEKESSGGGGSDESGKSLKVGGAGGYKDVTDAIKADVGDRFDSKHEKVFRDRYATASDTKKLGSIHRKAIKDLDNDDLDAKEGILNSMKKAMQSHLEANQASGKGVKREKELESMSPEERRRASTSDRIQRGIKNKVVSGRRK